MVGAAPVNCASACCRVGWKLTGESPADSAFVGTREVFHDGEWRTFDVWQMEELRAGNVIRGPSIIRDPMTTVVTPPGYEIAFDPWLVMHYRRAS